MQIDGYVCCISWSRACVQSLFVWLLASWLRAQSSRAHPGLHSGALATCLGGLPRQGWIAATFSSLRGLGAFVIGGSAGRPHWARAEGGPTAVGHHWW
ncbi:hypothetical protein B0T25DRAFT_69975 [Lasiosphaeria hispida]|uniref:Uncharacterized protein n=1 Tax=Lasiosphaeria hispida TaxID=260671 RepID=A0AAJ0HXV6_9PEZI|nr:hypothetical protein B0T25DRAFT_69975 [Lasiosphaeria hispida]